ncbi:28S ribosomal protein S2, mitochondrial-like [Mercenaria mercenaria]|uniref:28S ribosomal protein S2, mitochondrial-like n=1 Tax=Mercenaria mercenaria TaxID=6596 RepID=UPI00234E6B7E|nr:28S ribosomal protein S2, mitochondrial-like [Mercenaria mercenaria]
MKNTLLRFLCNNYIKQSCFGYRTALVSCRRCISNSVPQGQELTQTSVKTDAKKEVDTWEALKHDDYFNLRSLVTLKDLFRINAHFGHHQGGRNVYMSPYLFGTRSGIDIIDLEQTVPLFQDALNFTAHIAYRGGVILFVSRSKPMMPYIEKTAELCGEYAHCRYWMPGLFTDMPNKFGQRVRLPDLCIFINTLNSVFETHKGVIDSAKLLIPTVGLVDSNCDPRLITYPIPANDDSFKAVKYYLNLFETAVLKGKQKRKEDEEMLSDSEL